MKTSLIIIFTLLNIFSHLYSQEANYIFIKDSNTYFSITNTINIDTVGSIIYTLTQVENLNYRMIVKDGDEIIEDRNILLDSIIYLDTVFTLNPNNNTLDSNFLYYYKPIDLFLDSHNINE